MTEYHYIRSEPGLWTVGTGTPGKGGNWEPESDWSSPDEAAKRVNFLNGGSDDSDKDTVIAELLEALETIANGTVEDGWILVAPQFVKEAIAKAKGAQS